MRIYSFKISPLRASPGKKLASSPARSSTPARVFSSLQVCGAFPWSWGHRKRPEGYRRTVIERSFSDFDERRGTLAGVWRQTRPVGPRSGISFQESPPTKEKISVHVSLTHCDYHYFIKYTIGTCASHVACNELLVPGSSPLSSLRGRLALFPR